MVAVEIQFSAGRFHATPWGRHVNEGSVEWPPAPWRFLRALVAVWRGQERENQEALRALLSCLAPSPSYQLPVSTTGHQRHYVPIGEQRRLMLDTFVACRGLVLLWPDVWLTAEQETLLDDLLAELTYFGRAESWCEARRLPKAEGAAHSYPLAPESSYEGPTVTVLCAQPEVTLEQLELSPAQMRRRRYNRPPGSRWVTYALEAVEEGAPPIPLTRYVVYTVDGHVPMEQSVKLADAVRRELLRRHGDLHSPVFGGKVSGAPRADGHQHLHVLPEGEESVKRVCLWAPGGFGESELRVLRSCLTLEEQGEGVRLLPWELRLEVPVELSALWVSATPYVPARRAKKDGREGSVEQLVRECLLRGYPEPQVRALGPTSVKWSVHRKGQPPAAGKPGMFELTFPTPVAGPLCLGANSHFGLGRFAPSREGDVGQAVGKRV